MSYASIIPLFREKTLAALEGLDSPVINAFRAFVCGWDPEKETENPALISLGKAYETGKYAFCLSGHPDVLLHEDPQIKSTWQSLRKNAAAAFENLAQCSITGEKLPTARIHNKIKGVAGGQASGTVLVGFKTTAGCSYGNEQSFNSNISERAMKKYTYALNTLLAARRHKQQLDDITVVYWAVGGEKHEKYADYLSFCLFGDNDKPDKEQTEKMLHSLVKKSREGTASSDTLASFEKIDESVTFYILGIKPNASRLSVKFIYRQKCGALFNAIALHQTDMQIGEMFRPIPLWRLKNELKSPKSNKENVDASLLTAIFKSIVYGTPYPGYLFSGMLTRIKTDRMINRVRAGVVKACINRKARAKGQKEELQLALDLQNTNQAYLCGRLFAVLEHLQQSAVSANLNRTIKDAYFSSAASKPALVFPKLLMLSQNHMKKLNERKAVFYNKLIEEIVGKLNGEFPNTLMLDDQGRFMIGYYQQDQVFYQKRTEDNKEEK
nr:type I-C CRISPR-associated protein Cas8c/Csd1 [uncultured Ruminococcus sp.]